MLREKINLLLESKDHPCLSIILPNPTIDKKNATEVIQRGLQRARAAINTSTIAGSEKEGLRSRLETVVRELPKNFSQGIGIFLSANESLIVEFPFKVKRRVAVGDNFDSRDLRFLLEHLVPYVVLSISKKTVRLFRGEKNELEEIKNDDFPVIASEDYEYERPSVASSSSSSLKSVEKDKSIMVSVRVKAMLRTADQRLKRYVKDSKSTIILAGTERLASYYFEVTKFPKSDFLRVSGSYEHRTQLLGSKCWDAIVSYKHQSDDRLVDSLRTNDDGHLAKGIEECWQAVNEGRGLVVALERDYHCHAYVNADNTLHIAAPKVSSRIVKDAVDELITDAVRKHVKVVLVENNSLRDFGRVAVQYRY